MSTVLTSPLDATREAGAISWGAVIAGAVGAAALSLVLLLLGTGFGLAVVSPWAEHAARDKTVGVTAIAWVTVTQLLASALGGYLAGRLRTRWTTIHTNEVFFRDTAHGFLAWSVATLLMATVLSSTVGAMLSLGLDHAAVSATTAQTEEARKASALLALWLVVSLFVGAFVAAWAATLGGKLRDSAVIKLS